MHLPAFSVELPVVTGNNITFVCSCIGRSAQLEIIIVTSFAISRKREIIYLPFAGVVLKLPVYVPPKAKGTYPERCSMS
jgi:hypothetical protein